MKVKAAIAIWVGFVELAAAQTSPNIDCTQVTRHEDGSVFIRGPLAVGRWTIKNSRVTIKSVVLGDMDVFEEINKACPTPDRPVR